MRWFVLLLAALLTSGCGEVTERIVYRDHPVDFDQTDERLDVVGDPGLVLGLFEEQLFSELSDGDDVAIVYGLQGGTWLHLSMRVFGIRPDGQISVSLANDVTELGAVAYPLRLTRSAEGFLEAYDIPIPVNPPDGEELSILFGQRYTIVISFESGEVSATASIDVVLIDG